ncbi:urease accessory [Fusarium longipes]|uniref:Urease accessory n=1 Tax=Fusarium longipes TaxID=694270 RepID=A0A395S8T3_9HYPO|nr:urease accessory [Fusarium longipes]
MMPSKTLTSTDADLIQDEISELEKRLHDAKARLNKVQPSPSLSPAPHLAGTTHFLLLLSDSALPLGSFAFSSGLESYLAHGPRASTSFASFLPASLSSFAATTLPFVLAAHRNPETLAQLDDQLDAAIICTVVRANVFGPYHAQKVLAGQQVQNMIDDMIDREWMTPVEEAGQTVPAMDLWIGRHEILYSRIFNS